MLLTALALIVNGLNCVWVTGYVWVLRHFALEKGTALLRTRPLSGELCGCPMGISNGKRGIVERNGSI